MTHARLDLNDLECWVRRDPAKRGLLAEAAARSIMCPGDLQGAAHELANAARCVGIVTGFFVPDAEVPAAETDGPLGSVVLADALRSIGIDAFLITDQPCESALRAVTKAAGCESQELLVCPLDRAESQGWRESFWASARGQDVTHLIAVERVGPSHNPESIAEQQPPGTPPERRDRGRDEFRSQTQPTAWGRPHNMRGRPIDEWTADLDRLFAEVLLKASKPVVTIGIADGGNEIGMGSISWFELLPFLPEPNVRQTVCSIATDWTIVSGTSDWGAWALAAAVLCLRGRPDGLQPWTVRRLEQLLETMVADGPAVDGCTLQRTASVDGLPLSTYLQPWMAVREALGWEP